MLSVTPTFTRLMNVPCMSCFVVFACTCSDHNFALKLLLCDNACILNKILKFRGVVQCLIVQKHCCYDTTLDLNLDEKVYNTRRVFFLRDVHIPVYMLRTNL